MKAVFLLAMAAAGALQGCGSHAPAPIVYGTAPTTTGRVYNSPADYARVNGAPQSERGIAILPSAAPVLSDPLFGASGPQALAPVRAMIEEGELPPAPTFIAQPAYEAAYSPELEPIAAGAMIVQPGDTVYAIARRTGAGPQAIIAENHLRAPYTLEVGQTIRVPNARRAIASDIAAREPVGRAFAAAGATFKTVRAGDTLYSISRATGVSTQAIAQANGLRPPYPLEIGDRLQIPSTDGKRAAPRRREARAPDKDVGDIARKVSYVAPASAKLFDWPVKGAVIGEYGGGVLGKRNDGVNIAAPVGTPVRAAADGEVVYRGAELDGYGNLLLIKHADGFVTAYAHNDVMLVQKGQPVRQGQVIAKVGQTGSATEPQLHFEIRQNLKAVDPTGFLDN